MFSRRVRTSTTWAATATPLASIIGSGFLVIAPVLGHTFGTRAVFAIVVIVAVAYLLGFVIRHNIAQAEPLLEEDDAPKALLLVERGSQLALAFAYVISVSFYLQLMAAFVLRGLGTKDDVLANLVTTALLLFIGLVGWFRGLHALEFFEDYAVAIKLAVIAGLVAALSGYDSRLALDGKTLLPSDAPDITWGSLRVLMGTLIVVQGFETSRFIGQAYSPDVRIETMRRAQLIAAVIYVTFIALVTPLLTEITELNDTAIIDIGKTVTPLLPPMLIAAAMMSQFSAAVADTIGGGGLFRELGQPRLNVHRSYLLLIALAIAVTWLTNVFEVINLASRAFAIYYMLQSVEAFLVEWHQGQRRLRQLAAFASLALLMLAVVVFGRPAG
jgi:hypothetical protein